MYNGIGAADKGVPTMYGPSCYLIVNLMFVCISLSVGVHCSSSPTTGLDYVSCCDSTGCVS